jgi:Galactose mutarotase and related enzymes
MSSSLSSRSFGLLPDGRAVSLFTLTNARGHVVTLTDYGAAIVGVEVPDRSGAPADVVLGFDDLPGFLSETNPYFGCVVGRCGNRIARGRFTLDGKAYRLAVNNGPHHLHGGARGFDKLLWRSEVVGENPPSVRFSLGSPDGDEGYPGALDVEVVYTWTDESELRLDYRAVTDRATVVNLTNHVYFNLAGQGRGDVLGHRVRIPAERYVSVDETLIPTGELAPVAGTPMDFREEHTIGERLRAVGGDPIGYDHTYVLKTAPSDETVLAAEVTEPAGGRRLRVFTDQIGVQFYSGNFLDGACVGKGGVRYEQHTGFCLETQHFPDSPNQPAFPSVVLRPGQVYRTSTSFRFDTV